MKNKINHKNLLFALLRFIFMLGSFYFYSYIMLIVIIYIFSIFSSSFYELSSSLQIGIYALIDISYIAIYFLLYKEYLIEKLKDFKTNWNDYLDIGVKWWILGFSIMGLSNLLISLFTPVDLSENEEAIRDLIEIVPIYMLFSISIYAPFIEELLFRKSIYDIIDNTKLPYKSTIFIIISGFTFGFLHIISSLDSIYGLLHLIPYSALGISFAIIYNKTKNIFVPMLFHFIHNTLAGLILIYSYYF